MKNIIIKLLAFIIIAIALLAFLGFLIDDSSTFNQDWGGLIVFAAILAFGVSLLKVGSNTVDIEKVLLAHSINKNKKMVEKISTLEAAIEVFDAQYEKEKSSNIYILDNITEECLASHKEKHKALNSEEKPLFVLNGKKHSRTGFVITDKNIYFATVKRAFVSGFYPFKENPSSIPLEYVTSFQIGERDACFGNVYIGHSLMINGQVLGLVRLGYGNLLCDDKALEYINELSQYLFDEGFFCEKPQEFSWQ